MAVSVLEFLRLKMFRKLCKNKMKNFKKNIRKFFIKEYGVFEPKEINPSRDWVIVIAFFILSSIVAVSFGVYAYRKINRGGFFGKPNREEVSIETIDRSELVKAVEFYEMKEKIFQEVKSKKLEIIDPSL